MTLYRIYYIHKKLMYRVSTYDYQTFEDKIAKLQRQGIEHNCKIHEVERAH